MSRVILNMYLVMYEDLNGHGDMNVTFAVAALERKIALNSSSRLALAAGW